MRSTGPVWVQLRGVCPTGRIFISHRLAMDRLALTVIFLAPSAGRYMR